MDITKKKKRIPSTPFSEYIPGPRLGVQEMQDGSVNLPVSIVMLMFFEVWNPYLRQNIDLALKEAMDVKRIP